MANGQINIVSTIEEIRKAFPNNYEDEEIGEALCMLIEDNTYNEIVDVEEDWFDGY